MSESRLDGSGPGGRDQRGIERAAEHTAVVQTYLAALRGMLGAAPDIQERILMEVADHLYEALERAQAAGVPPEEAARQVVAQFGSPALVGAGFNHDLGQTEEAMVGARVLGGLFVVLCGYYLRFFVLRHEPSTLAQLMALATAAVLLLLQERPAVVRTVWFRGWRPVVWQAWAALAVGVVAVVTVFRVMDADAHSVSDTLNRIVPTYGLLVALAVKLRTERTEPLARL